MTKSLYSAKLCAARGLPAPDTAGGHDHPALHRGCKHIGAGIVGVKRAYGHTRFLKSIPISL